ncbi:MAG: Mur ligase family protein [Candidatus Margulisiibacteriota bacterium]
MCEALDRLKHPEASLRFIHVAGTNGKGTTCDFIAQLLESEGYRVGLYTSPHLISYQERFQINATSITEEHLAALIDEVEIALPEIVLTEFEILTLTALLYFEREQVDYVVWETGLGGRLDATNIVVPLVSVITTISYDHRDYLGETLEKIAMEKAGILKEGIPSFMFQAQPSIQSIIDLIARKNNSPLTVVPVSGESYLVQNKSLALEVASFLLPSQSDAFGKRIKTMKTRMHCRLQVLSEKPALLLDGAHNEEGIDRLTSYIRDRYGKMTVLYGATRRPDVQVLLGKLASIASSLYLCEFSHDRAIPLREYSNILPTMVPIHLIALQNIPSLVNNILSDKTQRICMTGSFYFLGEILGLPTMASFLAGTK